MAETVCRSSSQTGNT